MCPKSGRLPAAVLALSDVTDGIRWYGGCSGAGTGDPFGEGHYPVWGMRARRAVPIMETEDPRVLSGGPREKGAKLVNNIRRSSLSFVAVVGLVAAYIAAVPTAASAAPATCFGKRVSIRGTAGADTLTGTKKADVILAKAGDDTIRGAGGADRICGGRGADRVHGGNGRDKLSGGTGSDSLYGRAGDDLLDGGRGRSDGAWFGSASRSVRANLLTRRARGEGRDRLAGVEELYGSPFDDRLIGDDGDFGNTLAGASGADTLRGNGGGDFLSGGRGNDGIDGGAGLDLADHQLLTFGAKTAVTVDLQAGTSTGQGDDMLAGIETVTGTPGDDTMTGNDVANYFVRLDQGSDTVSAGDGGDFVEGGEGNDVLDGGAGSDFVGFLSHPAGVTVDLEAGSAVGSGTDTLAGLEWVFGSPHNDVISGTGGFNLLFGFAGDDTISGRAGDDALDGGVETDGLNGGDGVDSCNDGEFNTFCENETSSTRLARMRSVTHPSTAALRGAFGAPR